MVLLLPELTCPVLAVGGGTLSVARVTVPLPKASIGIATRPQGSVVVRYSTVYSTLFNDIIPCTRAGHAHYLECTIRYIIELIH